MTREASRDVVPLRGWTVDVAWTKSPNSAHELNGKLRGCNDS